MPINEVKAQFLTDLQLLGEDQVRLRIERGVYSATRLTWAIEWVAEKDRARRLQSEASSEEQIRITRSAKNAAWAAAIAAITAAIVAIVAAVISFVALSRT